MKDYKGKIVYITGGSSGIGLAAAKMLAQKGAHVAIFARRQQVMEDAIREMSACGCIPDQKFYYDLLDVSIHEDVEKVLQKAVSEFGVPDVLINCAGRAKPGYFEEIPYGQFDETIKIDLYGAWNTCAFLVPLMKKRGGYIVNVSSICGFIGVFGYSDYSAAKFGVLGFSEALRSEVKPNGITVSVLCPPDTDTPGYVEENKTKPPETKEIEGTAGLMKPEGVALALIKGMRSGQFMIVPGFESKFTRVMKLLFPWLVEMVMDSQIKTVQKKKAK
ncbi:MAG: SDR family oxidoreductase [Dehalococcoidia bacterium]|jgi:NAD(P)-dependent dehydrogenase (short-subunit alcohol dehydrogenase family)